MAQRVYLLAIREDLVDLISEAVAARTDEEWVSVREKETITARAQLA